MMSRKPLKPVARRPEFTTTCDRCRRRLDSALDAIYPEPDKPYRHICEGCHAEWFFAADEEPEKVSSAYPTPVGYRTHLFGNWTHLSKTNETNSDVISKEKKS